MRVYSSFDQLKNKEYYKKRKSKKVYIILFIAVAIASFVFWSILRKPSQIKPNESINLATDEIDITPTAMKITVDYIKGELKKQTESEWTILNENDQFDVGVNVKTSDNSRSILKISDGTLMRLDQNTEIKVIKANKTDIEVEQLSGQVYHRINSQSSAIYKVKNNRVEITALGTAFNLKIDGQKLILNLIEGRAKIKIFAADNPENLINMRTIDEGETAIIDLTKEPNKIIDSQKQEIFDLLGDPWFIWNKDQDILNNFYLGVLGTELKLEITSPNNIETEIEVTENPVKISGITAPKAKIYINGKEIINNNGQFEKEIELTAGKNTIEVSAQLDNKKNKKIILIDYKSTQNGSIIILDGKVVDGSVKLYWTLKNTDGGDGIRVVKSTTEKPTYPQNDFHKIAPSITSDTWENLTPNTYHFRVCVLKNQTCIIYSNDLILTIDKPSTELSSQAAITLSGKEQNKEIILTWEISNITEFQGFKVIIGTNANPTYPENSSHDLTPSARSDTWKALKAGTYHFRVCAYLNDKCVLYSNNISLTINEDILSNEPGQIILNGTAGTSSVNLSWSTKNLIAPKGYYILMSESPYPVFPGAEFKLASSALDNSAIWDKLEAGKTYHFRVCENLGGSCGVYSNNLTIVVN